MVLEILNTNDYSHSSSVLVDLGTYFDVNTWMAAIAERKTVFKPYLCGVKFHGNWYYLVSAGHIAIDAVDIINKIRLLPLSVRKIPNDSIKIQVDAQEKTLYVEIN